MGVKKNFNIKYNIYSRIFVQIDHNRNLILNMISEENRDTKKKKKNTINVQDTFWAKRKEKKILHSAIS